MTEKKDTPTKTKYKVLVNQALCKGCGICVVFCPKDALVAEGLDQKVRVIDDGLCIDCKMCVVHCPDFAIEVIRSEDE